MTAVVKRWRALICGASLAVPILVYSGGVAGASATPILAPTVDTTACAADQYTVAPLSRIAGQYGAAIYEYSAPSGSFIDIIPSPSFSPSSASDEELSYLGLPIRAASNFQDFSATYRGAYQTPPTFCGNVKDLSAPSRTAGASPNLVAGSGSYNWGGAKNTVGGYQKVVGHFTQPSMTTTSASAETTWIGLYGSGVHNVLVQAGTVNHQSHTSGAAFWELWCNWSTTCNAMQDSTWLATPNTDVYVSVSYNPSNLKSYYNVSLNGVLRVSIQKVMPAGAVTGHEADYVTEKFGSVALPTFAGIQFSGLYTYTNWQATTGGKAFLSQAHDVIVMATDGTYHAPPCAANSHILMYGTSFTTAGFFNMKCAGRY